MPSMGTQQLFWLGLAAGVLALLFALFQAKRVLSFSEGTDAMKKIASPIREGADAYLRHQYATVFKVFAVVFAVLVLLCVFRRLDNWFIPFAFLSGGVYSALAGFVGMKVATAANARTGGGTWPSPPGPSWASRWWGWACWTCPSGSTS